MRTASVGKKTEVPDAHEATGQQMQQEPTEELIGADGHFLFLVAVCVVLPSEGDPIVLKRQQPVVGNGNAVRVARKIMQYVFRPAEGRLGIHDPILAEKLPEKLRKRARLVQGFQRAVELSFFLRNRFFRASAELSPKTLLRTRIGRKKPGASVNPAGAVWRQTAGRNHTMDVRVELEVLSPRMKHTQEADLGAEVT